MTKIPLTGESDPVRRTIIRAMNRLLDGTPQRTNGQLNVTQLAIEADIKRWHLTHQHRDLKDLFQARAAEAQAKSVIHRRTADAYEELKKKHEDLQAHCHALEERLQTYATALHLLALENAALSGERTEAAKVRLMPRSTTAHALKGRSSPSRVSLPPSSGASGLPDEGSHYICLRARSIPPRVLSAEARVLRWSTVKPASLSQPIIWLCWRRWTWTFIGWPP